MRNEQIRMANRPKPKQDQAAGMPQTLKPKQGQAAGMPQTPKPKQDQAAGMPQTLKPKLTILVVVLTAFVTTFTGSALHPGPVTGIPCRRRDGRLACDRIYAGGSCLFCSCRKGGGYHQPEISTGDRSRFVYDLLYCSCFFYIHNDADFDSSSTGNRSSYDIQHQYSRTS